MNQSVEAIQENKQVIQFKDGEQYYTVDKIDVIVKGKNLNIADKAEQMGCNLVKVRLSDHFLTITFIVSNDGDDTDMVQKTLYNLNDVNTVHVVYD